MSRKNSESVPLISPVDNSISRPFWSVMIPTYNCANFLVETLKSVLAQDPGIEDMQIEVIDDCSTKDDPEAVVREIGQGRVSFFRKPQNGGAVANFNTCIERAKGEWIHILHGDDSILPGFYHHLRSGIEQDSKIGAAITRCIHIDDNSNWQVLSLLERDTPGILPEFWQTMVINNRIMTPSIVVKRIVYEHLGGFNTELIHAADWEMWRRIVVHYPLWFEPLPLACYREHSGSHTSHLTSTGANVIDIHKSIDIVESYLPQPVGTELSNQSREINAVYAFYKAIQLLSKGNIYEAVCQIQAAFKCTNSPEVISQFASLLSKSDDLLKLTACIFTSADFNSSDAMEYLSDIEQQLIKADLDFDFRDINLIAFPNWQATEEQLYNDLTHLLKTILISPQMEKISLFLENSQLSEEEARLLIFDITFNLLQEEGLDLESEPAIYLLKSLNDKQWRFVLNQIHATVILPNQNPAIISRVGADKMFNLPLSELASHLAHESLNL